MMRHIKLTLEYDGTAYAGWQSQNNATAIQDVVARAIGKMTEERVTLRGASRTDAGVHALAQVALFQTVRAISCDGFLRGLNTLLPEDIRVKACEEVLAGFHPIRDTKRKTYRYLLLLSDVASPLWRHRACCVSPRLDVAAMERAARYLVGRHDFKSFQGAISSVKTTVRTIYDLSLRASLCNPVGIEIASSPSAPRDDIVRVTLTANGFLKYMVRNIVGTLVGVGLGKMPPEQVQTILKAKDRRKAGLMAPPQGLYLVRVEY